jgi:hypothetical protein
LCCVKQIIYIYNRYYFYDLKEENEGIDYLVRIYVS